MARTKINSLVSQPPPNFDSISSTANNEEVAGSSDLFGDTPGLL